MADGPFDIWQPEILVGIIPGGGGTQMLTRVPGAGRALELCLEGAPITPSRALEIGLVPGPTGLQTASNRPRQMPRPVRRVGHESCSACCQYGQEWVPNSAYRTVGRKPATRINPSTVRVQASAPSSRLIAPARSSG